MIRSILSFSSIREVCDEHIKTQPMVMRLDDVVSFSSTQRKFLKEQFRTPPILVVLMVAQSY